MPILGVIASSRAKAPAGAFESIATITGSSTSSVEFTNIPGTFDILQLRFVARSSRTAAADYIDIIVNGVETGSSYTYSYVESSVPGANVSTGSLADRPVAYGTYIASAATGFAADFHSSGYIDFIDYANTNKNKMIYSPGGPYEANSGTVGIQAIMADTRLSTTTITSIKIRCAIGSFTANSHFALYGIKGS